MFFEQVALSYLRKLLFFLHEYISLSILYSLVTTILKED